MDTTTTINVNKDDDEFGSKDNGNKQIVVPSRIEVSAITTINLPSPADDHQVTLNTALIDEEINSKLLSNVSTTNPKEKQLRVSRPGDDDALSSLLLMLRSNTNDPDNERDSDDGVGVGVDVIAQVTHSQIPILITFTLSIIL